MFDAATIREAEKIAADLNVDVSSLLAVAEVESAGKAYATVDGKQEPLIRFEGHYYDKRLTPAQRKEARAAGLASPKTGGVANPNSQAARWALLNRAAKINKQAAYESVSWGLGQVMGAHWQWLGYASVDAMVDRARASVAGQMELMARFIDKSGLAAALREKNWKKFARGYNGPGYAKNSYDTKMARAETKWMKKLAGSGATKKPAPKSTAEQKSSIMHRGAKGEFVTDLQKNLNRLGYRVKADGDFGAATEAAVREFQTGHGLDVDGWAGPNTIEAIGKALKDKETAPKMEAAEKIVDDASSEGKRVSTTEIVTGVTGVTGVVTAAKEATDSVKEGVGSLISMGPWILLALVLAGGAAYVIYERRRKRLAARAAKQVMSR